MKGDAAVKIIGLTGGIACGKSTVADMLGEMGAHIIDADAISRSLTAPGGAALPAIRRAFGDGVFAPDGTLDRAALARQVFEGEGRGKLNAIMHPIIRSEMQRRLHACTADVAVLDVPLLFEAGMQDMAQIIVCVTAPEEVQIARMQSRNGYTRDEARSRIRSQWPTEKKAALSHITLDTDLPLPELRARVQSLYQRWAQA